MRVITNLFIITLINLIVVCDSYSDGKFVYDSKGKRDPFIPLITEDTRSYTTGLENVRVIDDIVLEGILWDPYGESIAILNGVIVKEKEKIGDVKIEKINRKSVKISINDIVYNINLEEKEGEGDEDR